MNHVSTGKTGQWNGTSWTEVNDLNQARYGLAGCGTTHAIVSGGQILEIIELEIQKLGMDHRGLRWLILTKEDFDQGLNQQHTQLVLCRSLAAVLA